MKNKWIKITACVVLITNMASCGEGEGSSYDNSVDNVSYADELDSGDMVYTEEWSEGVIDEIEDDIYESPDTDFNTEEYEYIAENDFMSPGANPLSTFSIDVDNASYTNTRRMLEDGVLPPADAIRSEEFINYFDYDYRIPKKEEVFSVNTEMGECPWNEDAKLLHVGLKGFTIPTEDLPASNLVFLLDVSGSMNDHNKLPLLKKSFKTLVDQLSEKDNVAIVTYAGEDRVVLESTSCENKDLIKSAIDNLESGGSTNGAGGINKAYDLAVENLLEDGNNRVILATDGDFNIGQSSDGELTRMIEEKREEGVFLTILGYGMGNYKDSKMESLADHGNGNYFYIDDIRESNRVLVTNLAGTLYAIAKDVKIQVEFNPALVKEYRLIGYENRLMADQDFEDDKKDAGELGAGHTVTAIYEIIEGKADKPDLKYQSSSSKKSDEIVMVSLRYKRPKGSKSKLIQIPVIHRKLNENSKAFNFSAAVAAFSMILRESKYINDFSYHDVIDLVQANVTIEELDKVEFLRLVETAMMLSRES
jgi:Ca-activated chloride channel family protein